MDRKKAAPARTAESKESSPYYTRRDRLRARERSRGAIHPEPRQEGTASDYIGWQPDLKVRKVIAYYRVSSDGQVQNGSLKQQIRKVRQKLRALGLRVIQGFHDVRHGDNLDRPGLRRAVAKARKTGAIIVVESSSRLLRAHNYYPRGATWIIRPTDAEWRSLVEAYPDVTFATVMEHPDAPPTQERSYQSKRGQEGKGNKGGRPRKLIYMTPSQRKELLMPEIQRLRAQTGPNGKPMGYGKIATTIKANWPLPCKRQLSSRTVREWLRGVE